MAKKNFSIRTISRWYEVYREVGNELAEFYKKYNGLSGKELYKLCITNTQFNNTNRWIEKFKPVFGVESLDPIHIFTIFNASGQSDENRIEKINLILKIISSTKSYSHIDFTGCPTPFMVRMVAARDEKSQKEIWETFYRTILRKHQGINQTTFNKIFNWFGVNISSFTIFLFWISSENFLPLDKNTFELLKNAGVIRRKPSSYIEYAKLIPAENSELYRLIAKNAYDFKNHLSESESFLKIMSDFFGVKTERVLSSANFKVLAIRTLDGTNTDLSKVLRPNQIYSFYSCYDFSNPDAIRYFKQKDVNIYSIKDKDYPLDINVCAIVGKNGSGKSSIIELLYLAINNYAKNILSNECDLISVEQVNIELYYHLNTICKIVIEGKSINAYQYQKNNDIFENPEPILLSKEDLVFFFYSISVNYSHYSLNSLEIGNWIDELFHKNDGYKVPLVINPMRTEGNIDINKENSLVISRLLSNILEPVSSDSNVQNLREITDNGRRAEKLIFSLANEKLEFLYDKKNLPSKKMQNEILKIVYKFFKVPQINNTEIRVVADKYIYKKMVSICRNYEEYHSYYSPKSSFVSGLMFKKFLTDLKKDPSHKTWKFKQAINYLKYNHLKHLNIGEPIEVEAISDNILNEIKNHPRERLTTYLLIPPSFFKVEIILSDGSSFNLLSSGEKQKIHIVSSIVYHLLNLNSVSQDSIKYSYVNLLFDEIELYFHPEMQRSFVSYLLKYLAKVKFSDLSGLNICFATHSPFILSDIPSNNILFLKNKAFPVEDTERLKTFGANIHDLLSDSFFLVKGFIGEYAEEQINNLIDWTLSKPTTIKDKEEAKEIINIIDDPIIKVKLVEMYAKKVGENMEIARLKAQQEFINNRLKELGNND
jgi:predicted ATP-binding protein involved in virulence